MMKYYVSLPYGQRGTNYPREVSRAAFVDKFGEKGVREMETAALKDFCGFGGNLDAYYVQA